ncbi:DNA/RNA non-specific endonuclease [Agrobacterium sp. BA1120]|uniref:DNA/RNA non-specific endonuclease n=2 Tax=Rhizobium/Agrobacterium group TaxID=227290 RepID=UPI00336A3EBA
MTYNRYRYYDNLAACYATPDPLGIRGGPRPHGHVDNPMNEVDPVGLSPIYGPLDGYGRPTGVWATLTSRDLRPTGTSPPTLNPPGFASGTAPNFHQRSHLLADTLGRSGSDPRNLVTLTDGSNHPGMSRIERQVRDFLRKNPNCSVTYVAIPLYNGSNLTPTGVAITARTSAGEMLASTIVPNGLRQNRK